MKIEGTPSAVGNGYAITGYYIWTATGSPKPKLFELSSPIFSVKNFTQPYDAILPSGFVRFPPAAAGRRLKANGDVIFSNRSGAFYYSQKTDLVGTCHGFGRTSTTLYSGFNFYNAFYPLGYYAPPFGETFSLLLLNKDEMDNLSQGGACPKMTVTEYNEQFGIISKVAPDANLSTDTLTPGSLAQIMSLNETCPESTVAVSTYYEEVQAKRIAGTVTSLAAPTLYNHNPIPTSLDNYDNWVDGRYQYTVTTEEKVPTYHIQFGKDQRPIANYSSGDTNHSRLNNTLCYAQLFETDTAIGKLTNGMQMTQAPDIIRDTPGSQVSAAGQEPWHYWHFLFRENAETIPFESTFKQIRPGVTKRTISEGTQMFTPVLSSEDAFWQNRQCSDTVDFLPWTFGASIYACPSLHFDVPYYAAIKKFGFYGTRFLNSCTKLNLDFKWNNVPDALEVQQQVGPLDSPEPEVYGVEGDGVFTSSLYDNLLRTAKAEERHSNMYALNKGFFLWANTGCIAIDPRWAILITDHPEVNSLLLSMVYKFQNVYQSGLSSFLSGEPTITLKNGQTTSSFSVVDEGRYSDILFTNDAYLSFRVQLDDVISGTWMNLWNSLEKDYAYYVSNCAGGINEPFYRSIISGREKRMRTRFFENIVRGNPIDLFPFNHITFSSDSSSSYISSTGWGRASHTFGKSSDLPPVTRRYFEGAYGASTAASGVCEAINALSMPSNAAFYPGFFNMYSVGKETATPQYTPVASGYIRDTSGRRFSASGWLAIGYNEIGGLDKNFSCFTPIFTQQPLPKVFCKIGQHPTLRVTAVDYHTIPEDKISSRYPEIAYWLMKLKITNGSLQNNYPLKYRWFRVKKNQYDVFKALADFSLVEFSDPKGAWCALEGDKSTCTIVHPNDCSPVYADGLDESSYVYIQGVRKNFDDDYYYMCLVTGRFGVRISEPSELVIEDWVRFDISVKNGMNAQHELKIKFFVYDKSAVDHEIVFTSDTQPAYAGYQFDKYAIPESVVEMKIPPPNAGFGDVTATRFVGPCGYVGATRTYAPATLKDTRGLREAWGRLVDYGKLVVFSKVLTQTEGDLLYGYRHLPTCENYRMGYGNKGIKVIAYVNDNPVTHWSLSQKAYASIDGTRGMNWNKINGLGSLYPPASTPWESASPGSMGMGHWQWGNNLGAIKRFGFASKIQDNDLVLVGRGISSSTPMDPKTFKDVKKKFITPTALAGTNCGYTKYGLGRNMLYYIEAYDRFYLICDPVKKKNVTNLSFMAPGLRLTNSATQYFWLGQPSNTYVERRAMYGPYAYQWRVRRHNRDRNGNGISLGYYSMNYDTRYSLMYDAPAIYGLYVKRESSAVYKNKVNSIKALRAQVFGTTPELASYRNVWFGEAGSDGSSRAYGSNTFSCEPDHWAYNKEMCEYMSAAKDLASDQDLRAYSCPESRLQAGSCFDPCLSMRFSHGFFPGGKAQTLFGYSSTSKNLPSASRVRLTSLANKNGSQIISYDEPSTIEKNVYFRSPLNTPHARIWRKKMVIGGTLLPQTEEIVGFSPCQDGGSDHCNYITPTVHLDFTSAMLGKTTNFNACIGNTSNLYTEVIARGGE